MKFWDRVNDVLFRKDLYVQSLQSMIKSLQGQIEELRKDKEYYRLQYEVLLSKPAPEVQVVLDAHPMDDAEYWKPLRQLPELPSQKRERLHRESVAKRKQLDKEKATMKQELEKQ